MSSLRAVRRLPNTGEIFVAREKSWTPLRTRTRQHRDDYQGSLNGQLTPDRINFPTPAQGDRSYTDRLRSQPRLIAMMIRGLRRWIAQIAINSPMRCWTIPSAARRMLT